MIPMAHPSPQPKWHLDWFSHIRTGNRRVSLHFTVGRPFSPQNCPFPCGDLDPRLIHGSLGQPESTTKMASRSVQPFSQGSPVWQTDRPTDHATQSVTIGRIYVRSTVMRPKNERPKCLIILVVAHEWHHLHKNLHHSLLNIKTAIG